MDLTGEQPKEYHPVSPTTHEEALSLLRRVICMRVRDLYDPEYVYTRLRDCRMNDESDK